MLEQSSRTHESMKHNIHAHLTLALQILISFKYENDECLKNRNPY